MIRMLLALKGLELVAACCFVGVIEFARLPAVAVYLLFVHPMLLIPAKLIRLWEKTGLAT